MNDLCHSLFIVTGKGGVGKTTISLALTHLIQKKNKRALYVTFENKKNDIFSHSQLNIPQLNLNLKVCAEEYVEKKLNNKLIAKAVVNMPFFQSLLNMLPGFSYVIYLGKILEIIHKKTEYDVIILDAPASGHTLTMIESTQNFADIFKTGPLYDDTQKMLQFLNDKNLTKYLILSLPSQLAWSEALEMNQAIISQVDAEVEFIMNNLISKISDLNPNNDWPKELKQKYENERSILLESQSPKIQIPHFFSNINDEIITQISEHLDSAWDELK